MQIFLLQAPLEFRNVREEIAVDAARQRQEELEVLLRHLASEAHVALALQFFVHFGRQRVAVLDILVVELLGELEQRMQELAAFESAQGFELLAQSRG